MIDFLYLISFLLILYFIVENYKISKKLEMIDKNNNFNNNFNNNSNNNNNNSINN